MGILEKTIGLAGMAAAGGIALTKSLLGNNKKKIAELDTEFARTTADYQARKSKLKSKIENGNLNAVKKLEALEREYFVDKAEYENKRKTLLPKKSKLEEERETKEFDQRLAIEKAQAFSKIDIEKKQAEHNFELEKGKNYHQWDLEDTKTIHTLELEKDKNHHEWDLETARCLHDMEMEKIELTAKLGVSNDDCTTKQEKNSEIVCSNCGNKNSINSKFCGECGRPLNRKKFCDKCGASLDTSSKFCSMCGQAIE